MKGCEPELCKFWLGENNKTESQLCSTLLGLLMDTKSQTRQKQKGTAEHHISNTKTFSNPFSEIGHKHAGLLQNQLK